MNRAIKFRAWGGGAERKYFVHFNLDSVFEDYVCDIDNCGQGSVDGDLIHGKGNIIAVQQFTGLLDKNGKEIYEGDVIRTERCTFEVVYQECEFGRTTGNGIVSLNTVRDYEGEELEVIGNIYENPELVKV